MWISIYVAAVRREIQDETDRETGRTKQISSVPIHLSIYSPNGKICCESKITLPNWCLSHMAKLFGLNI